MNGNEILEKVYKDARMGMYAIDYIHKDVKNTRLGEDLLNHRDDYKSIALEAGTHLCKQDELPNDNSVFEKAGLWGGIKLKTITDKSDPKIAQMVINGSRMGIDEMKEELHRANHSGRPEIQKLCQRFISTEEGMIDRMKQYI